MTALKLVDSKFVEVEDPIDDTRGDDFRVCLANAGFVSEISTGMDNAIGAEVSIYARAEVPRYYIDLMGGHSTIANVVADDFSHLVATLKELHPLLTLIGLDQVNMIRVDRQLELEDKKRQR